MTINPVQLKAARSRLDDDVASVVGVDVLTIVNFENGKRNPDARTLHDIRIALEAAGAHLKSSGRSRVGGANVWTQGIGDEAASPPIPSVGRSDGLPV
jgi:hypothetical protein